MKLDPYLAPCTKINSKWIHELNIRPKTIKYLEENIGQNILTFDLNDNGFLDMTLKAQATKKKLHKFNFIKIYNVHERILSRQ